MEKVVNFLKQERIFFLIALFGLILKVTLLGDRPLHHDESLHAQYGKYFANSFTKGYYKYDPLLHGPLLYHLQGLWTWLAGPLTNSGVRFIPVVLGFLISLSPLAFLKYANRTSLLFITLFLSISPTFTYWSRFIRHDFLVISSIIAATWILLKKPKNHALYLGLMIGVHFSSKENFYVHIAIAFGFLITRYFIEKKYPLAKLKQIAWIFLGFFLVSIPLYTAWFQYSDGIIDGLFKKSLSYWITQHHSERISGPFFFNSLIISIYETWLIPCLGILFFHWFKQQSLRFRIIDISAVLVFAIVSLIMPTPLPSFFSVWLKTKNGLDVFLFFSFIYIALRTTIFYLRQHDLLQAALHYTAFSLLFTYSYLGEKVPWLAIYPTLALVLLIAYQLKFYSTNLKIIVFASLILCLPKTIYINHIVPGSERELISQVHTSREYEDLLLKLKASLETPVDTIKPRVLVLEDNGWPLSWYIWGLNGVDYNAAKTQYANYDFIFDKQINSKTSAFLRNTHNRHSITLRHYWWPDFSQITFSKWCKLAFLHKPWSESGFYKVAVWRKKNGFFSEE